MFQIVLIYRIASFKKCQGNNDDNFFQYALTVVPLNHQNIGKNPQIISKINLSLISIIGMKQIFLYTQKTGKSLNKPVRELLLISYLYHTILKDLTRIAYKSKHNFKHESQVILLMITGVKKWHYLPVKVCLHYLEE